MKQFKRETYIIVNGLAYDIYKMPFWKRWKLIIKKRLGYRIDAL